ncbi:hypothetical protein OIO90_003760 [Microbotryomycetes sp. JL221]|nr:hypothetical protein OIO90_003760 [Microbotryomycetes sp. JL221]
MYDEDASKLPAGFRGAASSFGPSKLWGKSTSQQVPPSPFLGWAIPKSRRSRKRLVLRIVTAALAVFVLGMLGGMSLLDDRFGVKSTLEDFGINLNPSSCANPFAELGRLRVDTTNPDNNRWIPYNPSCETLPLIARLRKVTRPKADKPLALPLPKRRRPRDPKTMPMPWLHGKTVLLFGDQIERQHNKDFCHFAGGKFASINAQHPLSPRPFVNGIDEKVVRNGNVSTTFEGSRPSVCYVEQYDFVVVSAFHYGLANRVEFERGALLNDEHFHPPLAFEDRLDHIVTPFLRSLNRTPDLIEMSSGLWDLRHFASADRAVGKSVDSDLTEQRLEWYSTRLRRALTDIGRAFPDTPVLWRSLLHTPKYPDTPYSRVAALDQLSRQIVHELNRSGRKSYPQRQGAGGNKRLKGPRAAVSAWSSRTNRRRNMPRGLSLPGKSAVIKSGFQLQDSQAEFLRQVKERIGERDDQTTPGSSVRKSRDHASLRGRLRVDEWGHLMLSQQHLIDDVTTSSLPGGYLWGDIMLFELRRLSLASYTRFL